METIYLVDMVTLPHNLQSIIEKQDPSNTVVYAFCGQESPRVALGLVPKYSEWVQKQRLHIIEPATPLDTSQVSQSLAFWAGKLMQVHGSESSQFFIASEDSDIHPIAVLLRKEGYTVESSWPDPESVMCDDDTLCTVLRLVQSSRDPPRTLKQFLAFLKDKLPPYMSIESVIRKMQQEDIITLHKGAVQFSFPVFLDNSLSVSESRPSARNRTKRRDTRVTPDSE